LVAPMGPLVIISVIGGLILLLSAILLIFILIRSHFGERTVETPLRYALAVNPPAHVPSALNGFALWNTILLVLMLVAYKPHSVPAYDVSSRSDGGGER
jgi:cytochrome c oxidase subunit I